MAEGPGWGVFDLRESVGPWVDEVHVAPAGPEGELIRDHELTRTCPCGPNVSHPRGPLGAAVVSHRDPTFRGARTGPS